MHSRLTKTLALTAAISLGACATGPGFDTSGIDPALTPQQTVTHIDTTRGQRVLWGGVILATHNLKDSTQIEVLFYPLDSDQKPRSNQAPEGRFLLLHPGYLEPADYEQGRAITALGVVRETRTGQIGDAEYTYPVMNAERIHLWPRPGGGDEPRFHFGVGVMFHN